MKRGNTTPAPARYSQAFKLQVVREYERGNHTKDSLMSKYHIGGHSTVLQWCRKILFKETLPGRPLKDPQKQRIKELEYELKQAREKILVYEKLLEVRLDLMDEHLQQLKTGAKSILKPRELILHF